MAITASDSGGKDFKKVPPGCHFAICNMVVDLGTQESTYKGQKKTQPKVYIRWEVPDERVSYTKDGKDIEGPCSIGTMYTLSLSQKALLRRDLENWRGKLFTEAELKGFDITVLAGKSCQIIVQHSEDGKYANVTGVMAVSKDQKERAKGAKSEVGVMVFSLSDPDDDVFERLPNWIKEKIEGRIAAPSVQKATSEPEFDDDIPF